jgi:hypothetical protein
MKKSNVYKIILCLTIILFIPWFNNVYYLGHDSYIHIANVLAYSNTINFPHLLGSFVYPYVGKNLGYGTGIFYPLLPDLIPAYLYKITSIFGFNVLFDFKIYYFLIVLISGFGMYKLEMYIHHKKSIALISSALYIYMPYFISDIFVRDSTAEALIFAVLPFIYLSIMRLFDGDHKAIFMFIISYVIGMNSHLVMMIYVTIFVIIYLLFNFKKTIKNLKYFVFEGIFILLICSPYIIRMLEYKSLDYVVFNDGMMSSAQSVHDNFVNFWEYVIPISRSNGISFFGNEVGVLLFIITLYMLFKHKIILDYEDEKLFKYVGFCLILLVFIMSIIMPWAYVPKFLLNIQFPWRLITIFDFLALLIAPTCLRNVKQENIKKTIEVLLILTIFFGYTAIKYGSTDSVDLDNIYLNDKLAMGWQTEYLPMNTYNNIDYYDKRTEDILTSSTSEIKILNNDTPNMSFTMNISGTNSIELPRFYYLGYVIKDDNNNVYNYYEDEYGFISFDSDYSGTYYVTYEGTKLEKMMEVISIISIISIIIIYKKSEHKK